MLRYLPVVLLCVIFGGHLVSAQVTTGTVSGVVQDMAGAFIPRVAVTVRNLDTGTARTVATDARGRYTAPDLSLGNYEVQAQQSGFQTEVRSGITLTVGREAVVNITLKVGQVSEKVTVTGEAPLVESTTSSLSSLVDDRTVRDLPLNGRSYDRLALLQPGVVTMGAGTAAPAFDYGTGTRFSVGGSRGYANSFLLDGTDINDHANATPGGAAGNNLGVEGVREFKIVTNMASAEYGRSSGGVISAVTRGGTNELHGSVFEFFRNSKMDARNFFDSGGVPPFKRNQFGGALGGPIKKDKTFFFGTYEGLRQGLGTTGTATVPTAAAKLGNLPSGTVNVSPAIKPFIALYPDPNGRDFGDGTGEYLSSPTVPTNEDYFMIRVDHQISEKMSIFGRYSYDSDSNVLPNYMNLPVFSEQDIARRQYSTFQLSNILRPTLLNSFRFAYNRSFQFFDDVPKTPLGPGFSFIPGETMGTIQLGGGTSIGASRALTVLGVDNGAPRKYRYNLFQVGDDLTFVQGRHSIKMGADIKRIDDNAISAMSGRGVYNFDDLPSFLAGTPSTFDGVQVGQNAYRGLRESMFGVYGQDDFKMTQRLTLNLGLRWEAVSDPREVNGKMSNLLNRLDPTMTVLKNSYFSLGKKDFQPRVGLAWQLSGSGTTVLRAGFGIFHDHVLPFSYAGFVSTQPPFYNLLSANNPRFPNGYLDLTQGGKPRLTTFSPAIKEPAKNSYNLSLQHQLLKDTVLEVAYVGSESHHLEGAAEQNSPDPLLVGGQPFFPAGAPRANPNFSSNRAFLFNKNANYNALQVTLKRKSSSGLQYQAFYTFSKSIDEKSVLTNGDSRQEPGSALDPQNQRRDRGLSTFDAKHNFVVTTTYPFPFRFQQKAVEMLLGGWTVNGIGTFRSGEPFTLRAGSNFSRNGDSQAPDRPSLVAGASNSPTQGITAGCGPIRAGQKLGTPDRFFDPCAFSLPLAGTYGNLGRNTIIGPGLADLDLSLEKVFKLLESVNVQFRAELFNSLNHANFGLPASTAFTGGGAYIASAGRITLTTTHSREVQLGLKVIF